MSQTTPVSRTPLHHRQIDCRGYLRSDELWEVEARLIDTKRHNFYLPDKGMLHEGEAFHDMEITLVLDTRMKIRDVRVRMRATPYLDCPAAEQPYQRLVGMRIRPGWVEKAVEAMGMTCSCTHLNELLPVLATTAFQTIQCHRIENEPGYSTSSRNRRIIIDTCHGYREGGRADHLLWMEPIEE